MPPSGIPFLQSILVPVMPFLPFLSFLAGRNDRRPGIPNNQCHLPASLFCKASSFLSSLFCARSAVIPPWAFRPTRDDRKKVWEERQKRREGKSSGSLWIDLMEQRHQREQERRKGQNPGAIPPRNLGPNRFGRGDRWNGPSRNN